MEKKSDLVNMKANDKVHAKFKKFVKSAGMTLQYATDKALVEFMQNNRSLIKKKLK